jgi:hypothetical protein
MQQIRGKRILEVAVVVNDMQSLSLSYAVHGVGAWVCSLLIPSTPYNLLLSTVGPVKVGQGNASQFWYYLIMIRTKQSSGLLILKLVKSDDVI